MGTTLTEREQRDYRLGRAILALADERQRQPSGLEFEISDDLERRLPSAMPRRERSVLVPLGIMRAGLDSATAGQGQELVFPEPLPYIDALRALTQVLRLGADLQDGLQGDAVTFPRLTGTPAATIVTQNPGADVADSDQTLDQVTLSAKTAQASSSYSRQLLRLSQVSSRVDEIVSADLAKRHAVLIDQLAIQGLGPASNEPTGILNTSGVGSVSAAGAPTYIEILKLERSVMEGNVEVVPGVRGAFLMTPDMVYTLRQTSRVASSGQMVIQNGRCIDYPYAPSNNVPSNLGVSGTDNAIVFGAWDELLVGLWDTLQLVVDPFRLKKQGMIEVSSFQLFDIALRHEVAFAAIADAAAAA